MQITFRSHKTSFSLQSLVLFLGVLLVASGLAVDPSHAITIKPFAVKYSQTLRGDFSLAGNSVLSCSTASGAQGASTCSSARAGAGDTVDNDDHRMVNVVSPFIAPSGTVVFNASSSVVELPARAHVEYAELIWSGTLLLDSGDTAAQSVSDIGNVLAYADGQSCVTNAAQCRISATANEISVEDVGGQSGQYRASSDITNLMNDGSITWTMSNAAKRTHVSVANVQTTQGVDKAAGWGLVVVYSDPDSNVHNVGVQDGFALVANRSPYSFSIDGLLTPTTGENHQRIGMVTFEGDAGSATDSVTMIDGANRVVLGDGLNPGSNLENSAVTSDGYFNSQFDNTSQGHFRNTFGTDVEQISLINGLSAGATSATFSMTSTNDTYFPTALVMSSDVGSALLTVTKSAAIPLSQSASPLLELNSGDALDYSITVHNSGNNIATNVELRDTLPVDFDVLSSSGNDCPSVPARSLCKIIGTLGAGNTVTIDVHGTANGASLGSPNTFSNSAEVSWQSRGESMSAVSDEVTVAYGSQRADLAVDLAFTKDFVQSGQATTLRATVTNLGTHSDSSPTLTLAALKRVKFPNRSLPNGCSTVTTSRIRCQASAFGIDATSPLDPGDSVTLTLPVLPATNLRSETVLAGVSASALIGDAYLVNNFSRATVWVNHPPKATDVFVLAQRGGKAINVNLLAQVTDPDADSLHLSTAKPKHGSSSLAGAILTYTPPKDWYGNFTYRYYVSDGKGGTTWATIHVTITQQITHRCVFASGC